MHAVYPIRRDESSDLVRGGIGRNGRDYSNYLRLTVDELTTQYFIDSDHDSDVWSLRLWPGLDVDHCSTDHGLCGLRLVAERTQPQSRIGLPEVRQEPFGRCLGIDRPGSGTAGTL